MGNVAKIYGRRFKPLTPRNSLLYIRSDYVGNPRIKGCDIMLTVDTFVAILGLCLTSFGLGYTLGSRNTKQK